jgi:hypothetical protein
MHHGVFKAILPIGLCQALAGRAIVAVTVRGSRLAGARRISFHSAAGLSLVLLHLVFLGGAQATTAEEVRKKIGELKTVLADFDGKNSVATDVRQLRKLLLDRKFIGNSDVDAFVEDSTDIQELLRNAQSSQVIKSNATSAASAKALFDALVKQGDDTTVQERFHDLMTRLTSLIAPPTSSNHYILTQALLGPATGPIPKARAEFDIAWASITQDYRIHIIRSWFGDLRTHWREGRLCASTSTIRTRCQEHPICKLDDPTAQQAGKPYDDQILCGFDPAPLVDPRHKGVVIEFACARGGKDVWDALAERPGINPSTQRPWDPEDLHQAVLRSSGMSFRCPFPAESR